MKLHDTITAIATPIGSGGIAILRISGTDAESIAQKIVQTKNKKPLCALESHKLTLSDIHLPGDPSVLIDEALVAVMRAPHSYTGEDVVEINCHGGFLAADRILEQLIKAGARLAEAGEFTRRAFINGKTDLTGAEATMDIIQSHSGLGLQNAAGTASGKLAKKINGLRDEILAIAAHISAATDYPDEVDEPASGQVYNTLAGILQDMQQLIDGFSTGRMLKDGIHTVIVGKPNVGKSSVLNALARAERAIVTDIPGTTRDVIEEYIQIRGASLRLLDTAGIRENADAVEQIGIARAKENMQKADLCLFVIDVSAGISKEDIAIAKELDGKEIILILNKTDKAGEISLTEAEKYLGIPKEDIVKTATPKDAPPIGIEQLEERIAQKFLTGKFTPGKVYITGQRQKDSLCKGADSIRRAMDSAGNAMPYDLLFIDLEDAAAALGEITGETVQEEIIEQVFSRFCVGK